MKLIIDIPEEAYNRLLTEQHLPNRLDIEWRIIHGTPIPDNATNGDVLQMIFPKSHMPYRVWTGETYFCETDWWNAPYYQKGGKE